MPATDPLVPDPEPEDLSTLSIDELRRRGTELEEAEDGYSYVRQLAQGRLDTIAAELRRRHPDADAAPPPLRELLPGVLAGRGRGAGTPRRTRGLVPPAWADTLVARLDGLAPAGILSAPAGASDDELMRAAGAVAAFEVELSGTRTALHRRIGELHEEMVRRYREGAAQVDDLLGTDGPG